MPALHALTAGVRAKVFLAFSLLFAVTALVMLIIVAIDIRRNDYNELSGFQGLLIILLAVFGFIALGAAIGYCCAVRHNGRAHRAGPYELERKEAARGRGRRRGIRPSEDDESYDATPGAPLDAPRSNGDASLSSKDDGLAA